MEFVFDPKKKMDDFASRFDPDQRRRTNSINLFSPSKINLFLRVTAKRPDGYHDLASLFHVIDLGDRLKFTLGPGRKDALTSNARWVPLGKDNLVIKALDVFRAKTGIPQYFWIHLDKKVPTGAGLGGGSGNAATALWAANELTGRPASNAQLLEWSADIGSDVPVFFSRGAAYCTGRGEIVEDIQPPPVPLDTPMVLIKPRASCKTPAVFKKFSLERASSADPRELLRSITEHGIRQEFCVNDLEEPAFEVLPSLKRLKERISSGGRGKYSAVFMSGSGSTIVGVGDPEPPQFIYDEERYQDVFTEAAYFLTREEDEWYRPSRAMEAGYGAAESRSDLEVDVPTEGPLGTSFFERPESSRIQF
ncbi:4-diphosphocytidyl-2-C-methyl-D-erythritol kinase [Klebsormidium nitens]|uniref:4-(cytidine 5'-diphospho)-2-C-methyl-D-erythritol kinase n=1 Tax=Klebsormidium nitens TaxID=105231 RepID=A0A1Y1HQW7_KLENI|nr:4-diphosphocytidyl-2-C-methyl-D-erythritol kinase [Klebsormidium nitens]|eukprot:GAQ81020.1 4-diphosphocytidyl-2-C-methyl-D-erythritol kinase [Klebsormidium nitens]